MNKPSSTNALLAVRTHIHAGRECESTDARCIAVNPINRILFRDDGQPVWDNCRSDEDNAGMKCRAALVSTGYDPSFYKCQKC